MLRIFINKKSFWVAGCLYLCGIVFAYQGDLQTPAPAHNAQGHQDRKVTHRMSPEVYMQSPFGFPFSFARLPAPSVGSTASNSSPISYHGGPIMPTVSQVVLIWYGNWNQKNNSDTPSGQQLIKDAIWGLAQPNSVNNYSGITTGYMSNLGKYTDSTSASVSLASSDSIREFTQPTSGTYGNRTLSDASVWALVKNFAGSGDPNAIYLVLSSSDIAESSGFLTKYCGWHSYGTIGSNKIKYGFIGNPNRNLSACGVQTVSPNGNAGVDAMVSVIAHEMIEIVTDPLLSAWYNKNSSENSDMCSWTYGSKLNKTTNGAYWNVTLPKPGGGTRNYLLQRQLAVSNSKCYINATGSIQ